MVGWGGLFDYSVKPGPDLSRLRVSLVGLVTRSTKAKLVTRLARSRTRLVKARARSLTIIPLSILFITRIGKMVKYYLCKIVCS